MTPAPAATDPDPDLAAVAQLGDSEVVDNLMAAPDTTAAATVFTVLAVADTVAPTPEDLVPVLGQADEIGLWVASGHLWGNAIQGQHLDDAVAKYF